MSMDAARLLDHRSEADLKARGCRKHILWSVRLFTAIALSLRYKHVPIYSFLIGTDS